MTGRMYGYIFLMARRLYQSDLSDDEWGFVAPYLALLPEEADQYTVFNAVLRLARTGAQWHKPPMISRRGRLHLLPVAAGS
jgi:hypothetical protein